MEEIQKKENNVFEKNIINDNPEVKPVTVDSIENEVNEINLEIQKQDENISNTIIKVNNIRHELGLSGEESNIPSVSFNIKIKNELENKKILLENKLQELIKFDVSEKYENIINQVKKSKIDWASSNELSRRLKIKGATDEDVLQIKNWLIDNTSNAKTFVLSYDKYKEVVGVLSEMTGEDNIKQASAFHVPGGRDDTPEYIKNSVFIKEKPPVPFMPEEYRKRLEGININHLHHEFGHIAQDGLLESELYKDWKPVFKENAPDKEYVGLIHETDTRIQSMYRDLGETFDIKKEVFGKKHLQILKDKYMKGQLDKDTKDLFDHYDDITIMKMANRMPAI